MTAFWRFGLLAVVLVAISSVVVLLCGPQSVVSLLVRPVFLLLFEVPYMLLALLASVTGMSRMFFHGNPWLLIPLWTIIIFLWNGSLAALLSIAHAKIAKLNVERRRQATAALPRDDAYDC